MTRGVAGALLQLAEAHGWTITSCTRMRRRSRVFRTTKIVLTHNNTRQLILEHTVTGALSWIQTLVHPPKVYWLYGEPTVRDAITTGTVPRDAVEAKLPTSFTADTVADLG
jgi:hypothetical protein